MKKLVEAKRKGKPLLPAPEPEPAKNKVVNIMDALEAACPKASPKKEARRKHHVGRRLISIGESDVRSLLQTL
ncbi:non-homologous end joining protein Ku [Tunturiibacter psychrotolerans]